MKHSNLYRALRRLPLCAASLLVLACSRPKIIPDETLAEIFRDAYLTNAYINKRGLSVDSLDMYSPIFERYGYTAEDVRTTINNFSKRKSARLSDVVDVAADMLEAESARLGKEVAVLDSVNNIAMRRFTRTLYRDSTLHITNLRDTSQYNIVIDNIHPGEFRINMDYRVDTTDTWSSRRVAFWFERADSSQFARQNYTLQKSGRDEHLYRTLTLSDTSARRLAICLVDVTPPTRPLAKNDKNGKKTKTDVTFKNIRVVHIPAAGAAVDSLYSRQMDIRIFAEDFISLFQPQRAVTADSLAADSLAKRDISSVDSLAKRKIATDSLAKKKIATDSLAKKKIATDSLAKKKFATDSLAKKGISTDTLAADKR